MSVNRLPAGIRRQLADLRYAQRVAREAQDHAMTLARDLARELAACMSQRETARLMGLSHTRIQQLIQERTK